MAAPSQSPLRRWKRFLGAFASVDAAIEAADPALSRDEFRSARCKIVELLCDADDDHHAERLGLVLDDVMAESLQTLSLVPATPTVLATTGLAESVGALRKHDSERVRVLASGIMRGWRASAQDDHAMDVTEAMHKLDNVAPRHKNIIHQQPSTKKIAADPDATTKAKIAARPPLPKIMVSPAAGIVRAGLCSEEKIEAAKRKFQDGYREAEEAKRQRRIQVVQAPEMLKQRQKSRASCARSIVKKTFSVTKHLHRV